MENFPFAGFAAVFGSLAYLVNATANYKAKSQPIVLTREDVEKMLEAEREVLILLLDKQEGKIMRQVFDMVHKGGVHG